MDNSRTYSEAVHRFRVIRTIEGRSTQSLYASHPTREGAQAMAAAAPDKEFGDVFHVEDHHAATSIRRPLY